MRIVKVVAFLVGTSLLVLVVRKVGLQSLIDGLRLLGWRLLVPILVISPVYLLYTTSWQLFLKRYGHLTLTFWPLFRIKLAGEAANAITPLNFAGGDPLRVWLLSRHIPVTIGGASVVVDRTLQILAIVTIIILGNLAAIYKMQLPLYAKNLLGITATLLLALLLLFIFHQTRGLFRALAKLSGRLRIRTFSDKTLVKIDELDRHLIDFYRQDRRLFGLCFLLHFSARLFGILELLILARFLGIPMGIWGAFFFAGVIPVTNLIGAIIPGTLGVLEGIISSLFFALHWDPAQGLVLQLARRLRALFWILLGMVFLLLLKSKKRNRQG